MPTRIVEGQLPYSGGTGIGIDTNKVISVLLREEDNLIHVNGDNELYTDLQLAVNITPSSDFPVGVTVGKVLAENGWSQNGLILNWKTTSGDYARWLYGADGKIYFDGGQGTWKQVYYSEEVDALFTALRGELATVAFSGDYNDLINRPAFLQVQADWNQTDTDLPDYIKNKPTIPVVNDATLTIQKNGTDVATFTANSSTNATANITVPSVIDNVTSTSTSDALSANQGKELQDQIDDLKAMGRFLSLWDATTGQPISFPLSTPYTYQTGDYFLVETISSATPPVNYRPNGSSYTGTASSTAETEELEVGDLYIYDGSVWLLQINHGKTVSFANLAGQPSDNANLATALNAKADTSSLATVATTGDYDDLLNKPTIPAAQVNSDWNANSGVAQILNKPTIPTDTNQLTNGAGYITANYHDSSKQDTLVSGTNIKTVNGNSILGTGNITTPTYNAGEGIEIGTVKDYSAMQGPAPDGFHVPLTTEWQAVYNIWAALGGGSSDGTNFGIALKLPFAGIRSYSSASVSNQGTYGYYWSSSRYSANDAYRLYLKSTTLSPQSHTSRASGFSVRCFKNSPVVPTSAWTKLYGTSIESGGIFWSSTDGLISLSSDGQTWITIADKNLGATTVWNSGDTLSEANCGKYYQWGNNYGFPRTGTIANQSTTQVNASNYGPGNYYSSDTFIKYVGRWDSTDNGNLWGGETGVITLDNAITNTGVLSVNGQTGDLTISGLPAGGQPGQMIMMTSNGAKWFDVASPTAISLDESSIELNTVGATQQLTATVTPSTAVVTQVDWSSSDTTIATVSSSGLVTCVTPGNATITASTVNGLTATCSVTYHSWQPGANTIAYYPLDSVSTVNDLSSNNYTLTPSGTISYGTYDGVDCCSLSGQLTSSISSVPLSPGVTISVWFKFHSAPNSDNGQIIALNGGTINLSWLGAILCYGRPQADGNIAAISERPYIYGAYDKTKRLHICITCDSSTTDLYLDGVKVGTAQTSTEIGNMLGLNIGYTQKNPNCYVSKAIFENKVRTATEISDYFDQTKGDYGIS